MNTLDSYSKIMLLGGLLYFDSIRDTYLAVMKNNFSTIIDSDVPSSPYASVENTIQLFIRTDPRVGPHIILSRILASVSKLPPAREAYKHQLVEIFSKLDDIKQFSEQIAQRILQEISLVLTTKSTMDELKKCYTVEQVQTVLQANANKLGALEHPGNLTFYDPIASVQQLLRHVDKEATGISFIDMLLGGGIVWGEHGGCLGAPSGGKTVLANMIACNLAIKGHNTMLMQFEQSVKNNSDIISRVLSYLTGLNINEFRNKDYSELTPATVAAVNKCAAISKHIRITSFIDDNIERSVDSIINEIDKSCQSGFVPKLVIIDWLGAVVSEFLAAASGTDKSYPIIAQEIQDKLGAYGKANGISFFFLHQLSNEAAVAKSGNKPNMHDSYYFKGFAQKLEYCMQLGTKQKIEDGKSALWIVAGKVRSAEPNKSAVLLLNGEYARMEETKDGEFMVNRKGMLVRTSEMTRAAGDTFSDTIDYSPKDVDSFGSNFSL